MRSRRAGRATWPCPPGSRPRGPAGALDVSLNRGNGTRQDGSAGVQTGELVVVTRDGAESLHDVPRGLAHVG